MLNDRQTENVKVEISVRAYHHARRGHVPYMYVGSAIRAAALKTTARCQVRTSSRSPLSKEKPPVAARRVSHNLRSSAQRAGAADVQQSSGRKRPANSQHHQ